MRGFRAARHLRVICTVTVMQALFFPVPLSKLVQKLKGRSCRVLRSEFPLWRRLPSLWSPSWFVSAVGGAPLEVVGRCVEDHKRAA